MGARLAEIGRFRFRLYSWAPCDTPKTLSMGLDIEALALEKFDERAKDWYQINDALHARGCIWFIGKDGDRIERAFTILTKIFGWSENPADLWLAPGEPNALKSAEFVASHKFEGQFGWKIDRIEFDEIVKPTGTRAASMMERMAAAIAGKPIPRKPLPEPGSTDGPAAPPPNDDPVPF